MSYMTFQAMTTKQKALLQAVRQGAGRGGVYGLAQTLGRNRRRVFDQVALLESLGYLKVSNQIKNGRAIKSLTTAVTGPVMTVVNVSLPNEVTAAKLVKNLKSASPLTPKGKAAVLSFFAEVPVSLAKQFLQEQGIPISTAESAYKRHVAPVHKLSNIEAWLQHGHTSILETPAA
ncbi:MAG: hypothetical protein KGK44_09335 [Gammaproteobacteria bacterium]|nr:hypothetical protein [Gammaproteobacteria bacterium]